MIALDPEFAVGSLALPMRLTTVVNDKHNALFARLPRLERLRVQGKADDGGVDADGGADDNEGKKKARAEREKRKMRGKRKSLKQYVARVVSPTRTHVERSRYLRKQCKNVDDPTAVRVMFFVFFSSR